LSGQSGMEQTKNSPYSESLFVPKVGLEPT
jgi:hypothetical protein